MKIIGHRGARGLAPENTIAGMRKGLEHHVDELEFDLRVTKDNVVILHHDPCLTDQNSKQYRIAQHTYEELRQHKPDLATFESVLTTLGPSVPLYIEVKPGEPVKPIIAIIRTYLEKGWKSDYFLLTSFSQKTLLKLHNELPEIQKIVNEQWSGVRATYRARQVGTKRISMNQRWLWSGFISAMARRGWQLSAYPLNNVVKAKRWARFGLYGVVTDYPDRFEKLKK